MGSLLTLFASGLSLPYTDAFATDGAFASPWLNTGWAKTGGAGVAAVTLGAELVTNGDFSAWSGDNPTGWTIYNTEDATRYITEVSGTARIVRGASVFLVGQAVLIVDRWYTVAANVIAVSSGYIRFGDSGGGTGVVINYNATGSKTHTGRALATNAICNPGTPSDTTIDNVSFKQITLASALQLLNAARANLSASAKCTITDGTQAGVALCWDSATNPANGVIGYFDRTNAHVKLDKCVAGTWTSVIDVAVAYSAGAVVKVVQTGSTTWRLYYGGTQRGTDVTISDAGIVAGTLHGLFSTYANSFDDFSLEVS